GNGGPLTGAGSPRNAGAGALASAAVGFQSSAYALKSRRKKRPRSVLVLSPVPAGFALAGADCWGAGPAETSALSDATCVCGPTEASAVTFGDSVAVDWP